MTSIALTVFLALLSVIIWAVAARHEKAAKHAGAELARLESLCAHVQMGGVAPVNPAITRNGVEQDKN